MVKLLKSFIYLLVIAAMLALFVLTIPDLFVFIMTSWFGAVVGCIIIAAVGIFFAYLFSQFILNLLNARAARNTVLPSLEDQATQEAVPSADLDFKAYPRSTAEAEEILEPEPVTLETSLYFNTLVPTFHQFKHHPDLMLLRSLFHKCIPDRFIYLQEDKNTKEIKPLLVTFSEAEQDTEASFPKTEEFYPPADTILSTEIKGQEKQVTQLVSQLLSTSEDKDDKSIELDNGRFISKKHYKNFQLILPLPKGKETGAGNRFITFTGKNAWNISGKLEQWELLQDEKPDLIESWDVEGFIYALIYLKEDVFASIEYNKKTS